MKAYFKTIGKFLTLAALFATGSLLLLTASAYLYLSPKLPSPEALRTVKLQTPLRIYTADQRLMAEFGEYRRNPLEFEDIPKDFIHAILAAEDDRFYEHSGVDIQGLMRAASELVMSGQIQSGGSTITMQLARNFFLSTEQSFIRKFNEILLALRIEDELTKDEILTLYANKIFLGNRAYGIEAAARVYYGRNIHELRLDQLAMIAGLPKAPSAFNPLANRDRATERRNWILNRMYRLGNISREQLEEAINTPDDASYHSQKPEVEAHYAAEMARQKVIERWGLDAYTEGYIVTTTVDSTLQAHANRTVRDGLDAYDWRHGYRGPERHIDDPSMWRDALQEAGIFDDRLPAIVTDVAPDAVQVLLGTGTTLSVSLADNSNIRTYINENARSAAVNDFRTLFKIGDLIRIKRDQDGPWKITQIPKIQAALISLAPDDGAIRALVGGFDFHASKFNRAEQAIRQPGSTFKPFIYARALEKGLTPATLINDAPVVFHDPHLEKAWRPENDSGKFYGPTPLRKGLYLSRNLVSIRVLRQIGIDYAIKGMGRFGFDESSLPRNLSLALGTQGATPLSIAQGFTVFANGGYKVEPYIVQKVESLDGEILYQANPPTVCRDCSDDSTEAESPVLEEASSLQELFAMADAEEPPKVERNHAEQVMDPRVAYIMDSILKDVITKGTGRKALALNRRDIAGKTGTTNGPRDAWFAGYSPHLSTTVWVGFDENLLLGRGEYGGSAALPIWISFMQEALKGKPEIIRPQPPGLVTVKINPNTGQRVSPASSSGVYEYFLAERGSATAAPVASQSEEEAHVPVPEELF